MRGVAWLSAVAVLAALPAALAGGGVPTHLSAAFGRVEEERDVATALHFGRRSATKSTLARAVFGEPTWTTVSGEEDPDVVVVAENEAVVSSFEPSGGAVVVVADCGAAAGPEAAGEQAMAFTLADTVLFDVALADVLRGDEADLDAEFAALQALIERLLALRAAGAVEAAQTSKHVFFTCTGADAPALATQVEQRVRAAVARMWRLAVKPAGMVGVALSDVLNVHIDVLPHPRYAKEEFQAGTAALRSRMLAAAAPVNPADAAARLKTLTSTKAAKRALAPAAAAVSAPRAALHALYQCNAAMEAALASFATGFDALRAQLDQCAVEDFGAQCEAAVVAVVEDFESATAEFLGEPAVKIKGLELLTTLHEQLEPVFRAKLNKLNELSWNQLKKALGAVKITDPSLFKDMEAAVQASGKYFRTVAQSMVVPGATWTADQERRDMVDKMRALVTESLQQKRISGAYVPGMMRMPVTVSLHWLLTHPAKLLDALQDSLSFDEPMEVVDAAVKIDPDGLIRSPDLLPVGP